jgi:hypothetical protein
MPWFSNYMKENYDLIPLTSPSANIRPGAIMSGSSTGWGWGLLWKNVPKLSEVSIFANKVLNFKAGSQYRDNTNRIPANYDIQKRDFKEVYKTIEIPETFNVAIDTKNKSFGGAIRGAFGQVSSIIDSQFEESSVASIKITNSFKVTFSDPDYKDTLSKEIISEMRGNEPTKEKVKYKFLITEVHYASGVEMTFSKSKSFKGKCDARGELAAGVQVPNAGIETNWSSKNVLRLSQKQDLTEKQKTILKIEREVEELKDGIRRLSELQRDRDFAEMAKVVQEIEADVRQIELDVFELLNVQELRDDINTIKDDIQHIKDSISELQVHVHRMEAELPMAEGMEIDSDGESVYEAQANYQENGPFPDILDIPKEESEQNLKRGISTLKQHVNKLEEDVRKQSDLALTRIPFAVRGIFLKG